MLLLSGCSDGWCWPFDCSSSKSSSGVVDDNDSDDTTTNPNPTEFNLGNVTWLHPEVPVRNWPVTSTLSVSISNGRICLNFSGTSTWPTAEILHTNGTHNVAVNANPWVFVFKNGKWYGGLFEWLVPNGNCLGLHTVAGDHVKRAPLNGAWKPQSGETLYFMVSSLAYMTNLNNYQGRTNVVKATWP